MIQTDSPKAEGVTREEVLEILDQKIAMERKDLEFQKIRTEKRQLIAPWWRSAKSVAMLATLMAVIIPVVNVFQGWYSKKLESDLRKIELEISKNRSAGDSEIAAQTLNSTLSKYYLGELQKVHGRDTESEFRILRYLTNVPQFSGWAAKELEILNNEQRAKQAQAEAQLKLNREKHANGKNLKQALAEAKAANTNLVDVQSMQNPSTYRAAVYEEVNKVIGRLLNQFGETDAAIDRDRFWSLYWGDMVKVENEAVSNAMGNFGRRLNECPGLIGARGQCQL